MRFGGGGVPPLARGARDLAATARLLVPVLERVAAGETDLSALARALGMEADDVRRALFVLEDLGLVESTRYVATAEGVVAVRVDQDSAPVAVRVDQDGRAG